MTSKYEPLREYFVALPQTTREVTLTFRELEQILGFVLPKSATDYRQWWANQVESKNRPQADAWISARFVVDSVQPRKPGGWVKFRRK